MTEKFIKKPTDKKPSNTSYKANIIDYPQDTKFFAKYVLLVEKYNGEKLGTLELLTLRKVVEVLPQQKVKTCLTLFYHNLEARLTIMSKILNISEKEVFNDLREVFKNRDFIQAKCHIFNEDTLEDIIPLQNNRVLLQQHYLYLLNLLIKSPEDKNIQS